MLGKFGIKGDYGVHLRWWLRGTWIFNHTDSYLCYTIFFLFLYFCIFVFSTLVVYLVLLVGIEWDYFLGERRCFNRKTIDSKGRPTLPRQGVSTHIFFFLGGGISWIGTIKCKQGSTTGKLLVKRHKNQVLTSNNRPPPQNPPCGWVFFFFFLDREFLVWMRTIRIQLTKDEKGGHVQDLLDSHR